MNFSNSLRCNWMLVVLVLALMGPLGRAQQAAPDQPQQPPVSQVPPSPGQGTQPAQKPAPIVRQIEIQYAGPATLSRQRILSNMKTTVGQPYSETTIEDDVRSLYATGLVTNVRIYGEPLPDGVKVIVVIQTRVTLAGVYIQGAQRVKVSRIRREINLKINTPLDEQILEQARQKI